MTNRIKKLNENTNKLSKLLTNLVNEHGLEKTLKITGLNIINLFDRIGPIKIDSFLAHDIIIELFNNTNLLKHKIFNYSLGYESLEGTIRWNYHNKKTNERMYSICTPFWEGSDFLPIDAEGYVRGDYEDFKYFQEIVPTSPDFNSLEEIVEWFNNTYINKVVSVLDGFLEEFRRNSNI